MEDGDNMSDKTRIATRDELLAYTRHKLGKDAADALAQVFAQQGTLAGLQWLRAHGIEPQGLADQTAFSAVIRPD